MKTVIFICVIFGAISTKRTDGYQKPSFLKLEHVKNFDNIVGISSVSGITSRNGRVSSLGGITFFPGPDSDNEHFFPLPISSERDGKYASSSVQHQPGFASTSAIAGFGPSKAGNRKIFPIKSNAPKRFNEFFIEPSSNRENLENWVTNDFFNTFPSYSPHEFRNKWFNTGFNPFMNFWR